MSYVTHSEAGEGLLFYGNVILPFVDRFPKDTDGFRYAPSAEAWQRQLNDNAIYAADCIKCIQPLTGERPTELQKRARQEAAAQKEAAQEQPQEEAQGAEPGTTDTPEKPFEPERIYKVRQNPYSDSPENSSILQEYVTQENGMAINMKAALCERTLDNAVRAYPALRGAVIHSDRGTQYTSETYRRAVAKYGILQSMNSAGGRCHDNARCESMWARMKEELLYGRYHTKKMTVEEVKTLIWRYFISYWNNRRICSANEGLPPMVKRQRYYESLDAAA